MMITYELPTPDGPQPEATPDTAEYRDRAILGAQPWIDGSGNVFETFFTLQGNTTALVVKRYNPAGALTGEWSRLPPAGFKIDGYGVFQSGAHLLILGAAHEAISDPQRRNIVYRDTLENVAVPYPAGQLPVGAPTNMESWGRSVEPPPTPGLSDADWARLQQMIVGGFTDLVSLFGEGDRPRSERIRQALENKAKDALLELMTAADARSDAYRATLFSFMMNIAGQQWWKCAIESRLVAPDRAPAWVRQLPGYPWQG